MVARTATAQDDVTGDGTTSTVLLCGELLRQADRYATEGLHPRVITDGFDIARDATIEFLDKFKVSVASQNMVSDRDMLRSMASTSLRTKLDAELADSMTDAVVDAIQCISPDLKDDDEDEEKTEESSSIPIDLNMVEVMTMRRKMGTDSRFVNGIVLDHGGRHPDMPKVLTNCHVMTCNVTFEYEKTEVSVKRCYRLDFIFQYNVTCRRQELNSRIRRRSVQVLNKVDSSF